MSYTYQLSNLSSDREVVGGSTDFAPNPSDTLARLAKTLCLFADTGHSCTVQMEMIRNVETLDGV